MSKEATFWIVLAVVFPVGVVLLSECGAASPNERAVEKTVETFMDAVGHDGETACLQLSREAQAELKHHEDASSCERAAESVRQPADLWGADFDAIRFGPDNEAARVPPEFAEGFAEAFGRERLDDLFPPIPLEEGDGRWRITGLDWFFQW